MCSTCGCGHGNVRIDGKPVDGQEKHGHRHEDGTWHSHDHGHHHHHGGKCGHHGHHHAHGGHDHDHGAHTHQHTHADGQKHEHQHHHSSTHSHDHEHAHDHHHDHAAASGPLGAVHADHLSPSRIVAIERDILEHNDTIARQNRQYFADHGVFALNLVSSPGSGKTTLLVKTLEALKQKLACAVIEGDQQTDNDAERVRRTGVPAVQINTGKGCHLDARMVAQALGRLPALDDALLFIENVGNLVCPAAFDLGEAHKVAILSVTEGADKPLKYPDMFHAADVLLINKIDLLPYVDFDVAQAIAYAKQIQPKLIVMQVSATSGEGMAAWLDWLAQGVAQTRKARDNDLNALRQKVAQLEAKLLTA